LVRDLIPHNGIMAPGRYIKACLKPSLIKSFSVLPFTLAHIILLLSVESISSPDV